MYTFVAQIWLYQPVYKHGNKVNLNKTHSQKFFRIVKEFPISTHSQSNTVQICGKNKTGLLI